MSIYRAYGYLLTEVRNPQQNLQAAEKISTSKLWKRYALDAYSDIKYGIKDLNYIIDSYEDNKNKVKEVISHFSEKYKSDVTAWLNNPFACAYLAKMLHTVFNTDGDYITDPTLFERNKPFYTSPDGNVMLYSPETAQDSIGLTKELWIDRGDANYSPHWCNYSSYDNPRNKHPKINEVAFNNYFDGASEVLVFVKTPTGFKPEWSFDLRYTSVGPQSKELAYFDQSKNVHNVRWSDENAPANNILKRLYGIDVSKILSSDDTREFLQNRQAKFGETVSGGGSRYSNNKFFRNVIEDVTPYTRNYVEDGDDNEDEQKKIKPRVTVLVKLYIPSHDLMYDMFIHKKVLSYAITEQNKADFDKLTSGALDIYIYGVDGLEISKRRATYIEIHDSKNIHINGNPRDICVTNSHVTITDSFVKCIECGGTSYIDTNGAKLTTIQLNENSKTTFAGDFDYLDVLEAGKNAEMIGFKLTGNISRFVYDENLVVRDCEFDVARFAPNTQHSMKIYDSHVKFHSFIDTGILDKIEVSNSNYTIKNLTLFSIEDYMRLTDITRVEELTINLHNNFRGHVKLVENMPVGVMRISGANRHTIELPSFTKTNDFVFSGTNTMLTFDDINQYERNRHKMRFPNCRNVNIAIKDQQNKVVQQINQN